MELTCDLDYVDTCDRCGHTTALTGGYAPAGLLCKECSRHLAAIDLMRQHGISGQGDDKGLWYSTYCMETEDDAPHEPPSYDTRYEEAAYFEWLERACRPNDAGGFGYDMEAH